MYAYQCANVSVMVSYRESDNICKLYQRRERQSKCLEGVYFRNISESVFMKIVIQCPSRDNIKANNSDLKGEV